MSNLKSGVVYIQCDHFKRATIWNLFYYKVERGDITSILSKLGMRNKIYETPLQYSNMATDFKIC